MKPLTLEETRLKEEMKNNCLKVGKYKDEKAKDKFEMLCHLEDFEVQYWELQQENKILKENAENNDKVVDKVNWENQLLKKENQELKLQLKGTTHCFDEEEHEKLKKQVEEYQQELEKADSITQSFIFNGKKESKISYRKCLNILDKKETQQKEFIEYLENEKDRLARECSQIYEDSLGHTRLVNEDKFNEVNDILQKYKEIIGDDK